ncbi:TB2/DP1 proteinHVA22 family protein [Aphelenchoides avenae]|nr:TB2/DP1 proteinHVA22 family protein [Aphelenchus avenae]
MTDSVRTALAPTEVHTAVEPTSDFRQQLLQVLYDDQNPVVVQAALVTLEHNLSLKRETIFDMVCGAIAVYLIVGASAELVCNAIGFGYPAYASFRAIRTHNKYDDRHWLVYWTVFAGFCLIDFIFAPGVMKVLPIYWLAKTLFLLYLALPFTRGRNKLYAQVIEPLCIKLEKAIANYATAAMIVHSNVQTATGYRDVGVEASFPE